MNLVKNVFFLHLNYYQSLFYIIVVIWFECDFYIMMVMNNNCVTRIEAEVTVV